MRASRGASQTLKRKTLKHSFWARISEDPEADAGDYRWNIGRTTGNFQSRVRIVNGLFADRSRFQAR
jgi:hypothetical protein